MNKEISNCIKNEIKVYPIYFDKPETKNNKLYKANNWYVCVENKGVKTIYEKSIGTGKTLNSKIWQDSITKTYKYFSDKLEKK